MSVCVWHEVNDHVIVFMTWTYLWSAAGQDSGSSSASWNIVSHSNQKTQTGSVFLYFKSMNASSLMLHKKSLQPLI